MNLKTVQTLVTQKKELQAGTTLDLPKLIFNNMRYSMISKVLMICMLLTTLPLLARVGGESGGGGDATEARVDEIRSDILKWINDGGAKYLKFPADLSVSEYVDGMKNLLEPKKVIIEFTNDKVLVNKVEKTCRGFLGPQDEPHIRCNILRFKETKEAEQYSLVHHEYAGLAKIEANIGAASDYVISNQLTGYLETRTVLKLVVKKDPQSSLDIEVVREAIKMQINSQGYGLATCNASGEATTYKSGKDWIAQLDDMTSVKKTDASYASYDHSRYTFSYVDNKEVMYEQVITIDDSVNKLVGNVVFNILKKKRVNAGTIDNPNYIMDYILVGKFDCEATTRH
jgi:hypothetical protein